MSAGRLADRGTPVHAASFLKQRLIVLDSELLLVPSELSRIWLHELYHFVWWRLGNPRRHSWEQILLRERAAGELGWSAELRKRALTRQDRMSRTRAWREYCSESFCDTGAWIGRGSPHHKEATLPPGASSLRVAWWSRSVRYTSGVRSNL